MFASRTQRRRSAQAWPFSARHHGGSPRGPGPGARRRQSRYLRRPPREPGPGAQRRHSRYPGCSPRRPGAGARRRQSRHLRRPGIRCHQSARLSCRYGTPASFSSSYHLPTRIPRSAHSSGPMEGHLLVPRTAAVRRRFWRVLAFLVPRTAAVRWKVISSFRAPQRSDGGSGVSAHSSTRTLRGPAPSLDWRGHQQVKGCRSSAIGEDRHGLPPARCRPRASLWSPHRQSTLWHPRTHLMAQTPPALGQVQQPIPAAGAGVSSTAHPSRSSE